MTNFQASARVSTCPTATAVSALARYSLGNLVVSTANLGKHSGPGFDNRVNKGRHRLHDHRAAVRMR